MVADYSFTDLAWRRYRRDQRRRAAEACLARCRRSVNSLKTVLNLTSWLLETVSPPIFDVTLPQRGLLTVYKLVKSMFVQLLRFPERHVMSIGWLKQIG
jgi:hypothetical protein